MGTGSDSDATPPRLLAEAWTETEVDAGSQKTISRSSSRSSTWELLLSRSSSNVDLLEPRDEQEEGGAGGTPLVRPCGPKGCDAVG